MACYAARCLFLEEQVFIDRVRLAAGAWVAFRFGAAVNAGPKVGCLLKSEAQNASDDDAFNTWSPRTWVVRQPDRPPTASPTGWVKYAMMLTNCFCC